MIINRANLDSLFTGFNAAMLDGEKLADLPFDRFAMEVAGTSATEQFAWMDLLSTIHKWIGSRTVNNIKGNIMTLTPDDFEHTIGVKRNNIEDDQLGIFTPRFTKMGKDKANLRGKIAIATILENAVWIDGKPFFATDRTFEKSVIVNKTASALSAETFNTAYLAMMSYLAHNGEPLSVVPDLLVVGPSLRSTAFSILKDQNKVSIAGTGHAGTKSDVAMKNENLEVCDFLIHPKLVGPHAAKWFLMSTKDIVKPVVYVNRKDGILVAWDKDSDSCVKDENRCDYGVHCRGAGGLTLPYLCYGGGL